MAGYPLNLAENSYRVQYQDGSYNCSYNHMVCELGKDCRACNVPMVCEIARVANAITFGSPRPELVKTFAPDGRPSGVIVSMRD